MTTLVIVESPNKVPKISSILGNGYKVMASVGHVRDLPQKELGIVPSSFQLTYVPTERGKDVLQRLKAAVQQSDKVVLATDPDREGEAIAWHLADALKLKNPERVTFTAITEEKVKEAFAAPRKIDMQRVHAQEARRALDRMIGYRVSPALSNRMGERIGAGRVQSPAVRIVVERERAIGKFKETLHFGAELTFDGQDGTQWKAQWDTKPHIKEGEYLLDQGLAVKVAALRDVTVSAYEDTKKGRTPAAPFTTSTLQQAASQRLKMNPKRTMDIAQQLFAAGAITYHRTDDPNMDAAGVADVAAYAAQAGLVMAPSPRKWKAKAAAQEGHEAIRPTHIADKEIGTTEDERALYKLIWQRAVASQLADAIYAVRSVSLTANEPEVGPVMFKATGRTLESAGWLAIYADHADEDDEKDEAASNPVPVLEVDNGLTAIDGRVLNKKTKPPTRFKLATLVAELERLGIGRPSTYAAILENILTRSYIIEGKGGYLTPSKIGEMLCDGLTGNFAFIDLDYTRGIEEELDKIAEGEAKYLAVVSDAWAGLDAELGSLDGAAIEVAHPCPACGKALSRRKGAYGFFWSCTGYPDCKTSLPDAKGQPGERKAPPPPTGHKCPDCGCELARRTGVSKPKMRGQKGRPYDFYGCTGFPKCSLTFQTAEDGKPIFDKQE